MMLLMRQIQKDVILLLDIKKRIAYLKKKYCTSNPFKLADILGILVIKEDLGNIEGYYNKQLRQKQIHINCNLSEKDMLFTCAHELGHALLHPDSNLSTEKILFFQWINWNLKRIILRQSCWYQMKQYKNIRAIQQRNYPGYQDIVNDYCY